MQKLDDEGFNRRKPITRKSPKNVNSEGICWVRSLDGQCKLMRYKQSTLPLDMHGCIDTASCKVIWLRIWTDKSDPKRIARMIF